MFNLSNYVVIKKFFSLNLRIRPSYRIFLRIKEIAKLFSPKYRGKVLLGDVAEVAGEIIRETCKKLDSEADKREE